MLCFAIHTPLLEPTQCSGESIPSPKPTYQHCLIEVQTSNTPNCGKRTTKTGLLASTTLHDVQLSHSLAFSSICHPFFKGFHIPSIHKWKTWYYFSIARLSTDWKKKIPLGFKVLVLKQLIPADFQRQFLQNKYKKFCYFKIWFKKKMKIRLICEHFIYPKVHHV